MAEDELLKKQCSIYRVPAHVRDRNPDAYTPKIVSIGPYHHGNPLLMPMEETKMIYLRYYLLYGNRNLEYLCEALRPFTQQLMDSYQDLDQAWRSDPERFLQLMVTDGVFLWDCITTRTLQSQLFKCKRKPFKFIDVVTDLYLLENQLPLVLVERLLLAIYNRGAFFSNNTNIDGNRGNIIYHVLRFAGCFRIPRVPFGLHLLDLSRKAKHRFPTRSHGHVQYDKSRSASELALAGLGFRVSTVNPFSIMEGKRLLLNFERFDGHAESYFLNAIAFERLHPTAGCEIISYVAFMRGLIQSAKDVRILKSLQMIETSESSNDEDVASLVKNIAVDVFFDPKSGFCETRDSVNDFYRKKMMNPLRLVRRWSGVPWIHCPALGLCL